MSGFAPLTDSTTGRVSHWLATGAAAHTVSQNITAKFREAFESYDPTSATSPWVQPHTGAGDIIVTDGNSVAASYLVISKSPWNAGTATTIESKARFGMPFEAAIGAHMSQRTLGQEFAVEFVDDTVIPVDPDMAITTMTHGNATITITTAVNHGLVPGKRFQIYGCTDNRFNYPALVVSATPSPNQITATAGPGGTIGNITATATTGFVSDRPSLNYATNGTSMIFENATATNASFYIRSAEGDSLPSGTVIGNHSATILTTASVQAINAAYTYSFQPTDEYRLTMQADRIQWSNVAVDAVGTTTNVVNRTQVCPDPEKDYKFRIRAINADDLSRPVGKIISAVKSGSTTATITFDRDHGLPAGALVTVYGIRDQAAAAFPNILTATAITGIPASNQIQIVIGSGTANTSYGGYVAVVNGGNLPSALGAGAVVAQAAVLSTLADGTRQLVLTGNANWAAPIVTIGDYVELVGCRADLTGADLGVDGAWKIANAATTALTLVPVQPSMTLPADFASTNCGGGLIRRTDIRVSFLRIFDFERLRVEPLARPNGDIASAFPVAVANAPAVTLTSTAVAGTVAIDAAIGNPVTAGLRASNVNIAAMSATGDSVGWMGTMIGAGVVKPFSIPEADWQTPAQIGGLLNTTTPLVIKETAGAGIRNYVTGINMYSEALTNATDLRIREPDLTCASQTIASNTLTVSATHNLVIGDYVIFTASTVTGITAGVGYYVLTVPAATTLTLSATRGGATLTISGTAVTATFHKVLWQTRIPTTGMSPMDIQFPTPLRGSVATNLVLQTATASGAGAVYLSAQGYSAP